MIEATAGMTELQPEFPFVLHEPNKLIDGTVDLLCRTPNGYSIFDYKFTESSNESVVHKYQKQMEIYRKAADKRYPYAGEARTQLVVISEKETRFVECT
jgi:ATP-dependent exoDNAse (exonuclease V) beta subunit